MMRLRHSLSIAIHQTPSAITQVSLQGCAPLAACANSMARMAAQHLAEADPAGCGLGWSIWPAGLRDNEGEFAHFRRAA